MGSLDRESLEAINNHIGANWKSIIASNRDDVRTMINDHIINDESYRFISLGEHEVNGFGPVNFCISWYFAELDDHGTPLITLTFLHYIGLKLTRAELEEVLNTESPECVG